MSSKKWVLVFLVTVFVLAALLAGLNLAADPFGAFGDRLLHWFSYDETNNPRVAKLSYLEQHHGEYDSYILGCSSTSSFPVDGFNELYDASFYNLIMYGADMRDCEKIADYLIGHYEVKNLVLNVYLDNGLEYDEESDRLTKNLHYKEDPDTSVLSYYTRDLFAVAHIRAVPDEIVQAGAIRLGERVHRERAGGRAAEDIGIVFVVVLFEIAELCHARVIRLVVGEPGQQPVPERAEGIGGKIQRRQQRGQHKDGHEKDQHPFF